MYLYQIKDFLEKTIDSRNCFVVPYDLLPAKFTLPAGFVVNLDSSHSPGSHWIAIYINTSGVASYFCSFGMRPRTTAIQSFLRFHSKSVDYNSQTLQESASNLCGEYAALFLLFRFTNRTATTNDFLKQFSSNLVFNDSLIRKSFARFNRFSH